tara:strand:+ start:57 stop:452 length:396 start_codon:yes stop_codon:yes gene_type:complete
VKNIIEHYLTHHLSVEQIESLYEKTFGNPINHYPSMEVSQMIDEIAEESRNLFLKDVSSEDLRQELELRGYYTNNLWHTQDVTNNHNILDEDAMEVLDSVMQGEWLVENIFGLINDKVTDVIFDEVKTKNQ